MLDYSLNGFFFFEKSKSNQNCHQFSHEESIFWSQYSCKGFPQVFFLKWLKRIIDHQVKSHEPDLRIHITYPDTDHKIQPLRYMSFILKYTL